MGSLCKAAIARFHCDVIWSINVQKGNQKSTHIQKIEILPYVHWFHIVYQQDCRSGCISNFLYNRNEPPVTVFVCVTMIRTEWSAFPPPPPDTRHELTNINIHHTWLSVSQGYDSFCQMIISHSVEWLCVTQFHLFLEKYKIV